MKAFRHDQGTRVRIREGAFPIDRELVGREGMILEMDEYRPGRYGVVLDGEEGVRPFAEDELEVVEPTRRPAGDTGPGVAPRELVD